MSFHPEILTAAQVDVLRRLGPEADAEGFHLGGGTAVALLLGHRRSDDLDWFAERLEDPMALAGRLRDNGLDLEVDETAPGTLHARSRGVRVTFLAYRYPLLAPPLSWPEFGCSLLSLDDLAAMKLAAIAQRGARRDFLDLHALLLHHRPLGELLGLYRRKFGVRDLAHLLYALAFFDDAEKEPMPETLDGVDWTDIRRAVLGALRLVELGRSAGARREGAETP